jgi:chromate transporter
MAAGLLFVLPGAALILLLAMLYGWYGNVPVVTALFTGIKAAVLAIVIEALLRIARRSLSDSAEWLIAALSFAAIFFFRVPFPLIVLAAGLFGYLRRQRASLADAAAVLPAVASAETAKTALRWLAIWLLPLAGVAALAGGEHVLTKLAVFFAKLAVVSFGGAYAMLAYMAQDVVQTYGWLAPGEMLDGLGLAETTPGPLILVTEFVGYLAAFRHGGGPAVLMGLAGALVTLWATFAPTFLFIFTGAPYIEWLKSAPRLKSALSAITAAVVGVILNLSLWFALHVLFRSVAVRDVGPVHLLVPDPTSIDVRAGVLAAVAALLLFRFHAGVMATLAVCAALSLAAALLI